MPFLVHSLPRGDTIFQHGIVTYCFLCIWLVTLPSFFPMLSLGLQVLPNLHLPSYWPFNSLLSQWKEQIFTVYKLFHSTTASYRLLIATVKFWLGDTLVPGILRSHLYVILLCFMFICVYLHVFLCSTSAWCLKIPEEGIGWPRVSDSCEPPDVGAWRRTWIFCKHRKCF